MQAHLADDEETLKEVKNHTACDGVEDDRCNINICNKRAQCTIDNKHRGSCRHSI